MYSDGVPAVQVVYCISDIVAPSDELDQRIYHHTIAMFPW